MKFKPFPNPYLHEEPVGEATDLGNGDDAWDCWDFWSDPPIAFQTPPRVEPAQLELETL